MRVFQCVFAGAAMIMAALPAPSALSQTSEQIGWCTGGTGTANQAIEGCTAMIKSRQFRGDKLAVIYNRRGIAYAIKKDYDRAIEDYNQAVLHDISDSDIMYNRGLAYTRKGNFDHAISDFDRAISGFDPARYPLYFKRDYFKARGNAYRGKEDFARAVADYDEAIKLDSKFARAFYNRGEAKRKLGDTAGGDADLAQAKQLQKDIGPEE